ncbi:rRNA methyltransferase 1, mitochondrial isoform X2 [Parasteatoda tepidariorum]|uniref:rRNA methyltransferase 1, mitochondrial isoform X2 n=1 Tax=Parasteatoda tepidariorum TaxID=114398 RepID=UPI001C72227B|nr:rRNA methyltransferase 1, mitochondrial isoform X2 [Parasteatoda tepidariorum]
MSLVTYWNFRLCQFPFKPFWRIVFSRRVHRKPSKFKNEFAYRNNFKKAFENVNEDSSNRIISSDVVLGQKRKKNKNKVLEDHCENNRVDSNRLRKSTSLEYRGELLFGVHPVYLALLKNKRKFNQLFVTDNKIEENNSECVSHRTEIIKMARSLKIDIKNVISKDLRYLVPGAVHQGVCLDAEHIQLLEWKETESEVAPSEFPVWLVLEDILDPMNVGAIIRSAYYFGVKNIFTVRGNSCKMSPTVSKASSGALEIMDIYQIENLEYFIKVMISQNWKIVSTKAYNDNGTECDKLVNVLDFKLREPTILVLGNEGRGVSPIIQELCNTFISIYPSHTLHKGIDSLNVSVATGVILHCLFKSWKNLLE